MLNVMRSGSGKVGYSAKWSWRHFWRRARCSDGALASSVRKLSSKPFVGFFERTTEMERVRLRLHADG